MKNANPNGCDVVINNLHRTFLFFFPKILKIESNKGLQSLFLSEDFITTQKLHTTKIPCNFHLLNQNRKIQSFPLIDKSRKPISNFYLKKRDF